MSSIQHKYIMSTELNDIENTFSLSTYKNVLNIQFSSHSKELISHACTLYRDSTFTHISQTLIIYVNLTTD